MVIRQLHLMKRSKDNQAQPYACIDVCCYSYAGRHGCLGTSKESVFNDLGVGLTLYFKFVKYMIFLFSIFLVLSIPSMYFSIQSYVSLPDYDKTTLTSYLMATTIGSIGLDTNQCQRISYKNLTDVSQSAILKCKSGYLSINTTFTFGLIQATSSASRSNSKVQNCQFIDRSTLISKYNSPPYPASIYQCHNQDYCAISYGTIKNMLISSADPELTEGSIYIGTDCLDSKTLLPGGKEINTYQLVLVVSSLDAAVVVIYCLAVLMLKFDDTKQEHIL